MAHSVAFKCTYNNGEEGALVGFSGTCDDANINLNILKRRVWCSNAGCACKAYYDGGLRGVRPTWPCMESRLFEEWRFGAGTYHHGSRSGLTIKMNDVALGKTAIFTTRFPGEVEADRRIVGLFRIGDVVSDKGESVVVAARQGRIRLPLEEARELYFWAYFRTKGNAPSWGTLLFRYLEDEQVHRILADVRDTVRDPATRGEVEALIRQDFSDAPAPPPSGFLANRSIERRDRISAARKYGPGGEGEHHKRLKLWLAAHPEVLEMDPVSRPLLEHSFASGDRADLVFEHLDGSYTAIEVETIDAMPGAHQAIKYRTLLCAQQGVSLGSPSVRACLVAWQIPAEVRAFCEKYGVSWKEFRPPTGPEASCEAGAQQAAGIVSGAPAHGK